MDQDDDFNFFQGLPVGIDIRIDISISIRLMTTKFEKQVHLQKLTQVRLIKRWLARWKFNLMNSWP